MTWALFGLIVGIIIGVAAPLTIPIEFARYTAVAIVAILDSVLGAWRGTLAREYNGTIFISGLFINMILGAVITFLGDKLGLDLYLAVLVAFTIRILNNLGIIRFYFIKNFLTRRELQRELESK